MLPGLSGEAVGPGVTIGVGDRMLWQGPTPGEYATTAADGYRWFGADGSMVGCTPAKACVGIDAVGHIVVTTAGTSPRLVFQPDGTLLGRFAPDGTPATAPEPAPDMATVIEQSGVDLAALLDEGTRRLPFAGAAGGDPHLITAGGVRYTSQTTGQFIARGGDAAHRIQLQLEPMAHREDVSLVTSVAIGALAHRIVLTMAGDLTVDGVQARSNDAFQQLSYVDNVAVGLWRRTADGVVRAVVAWPDGGTVVMSANPALGMTVVATLPPDSAAQGLFGSGQRGSDADLVGRDGSAADAKGAMASWVTQAGELLFPAPVEPTAGFPRVQPTLDPGAVAAADAACGAAGLTQAQDRAACVFDMGLIGDPGFVKDHVTMAVPAARTTLPRSVAEHWPALLPGAIAGAPRLPSGGLIDVILPAAGQQAFQVGLDREGTVALVHAQGCPDASARPELGQAAMRLFDFAGRPVSDRLKLCGHETIGPLPAGDYTLVVANNLTGEPTRVRVQLSLP